MLPEGGVFIFREFSDMVVIYVLFMFIFKLLLKKGSFLVSRQQLDYVGLAGSNDKARLISEILKHTKKTKQKTKVYFRMMKPSVYKPTLLHNTQAAVSVSPAKLSCICQASTVPTPQALLPRDPESASL